MINGIERVLARRMWFVPDVMVWGTVGLGELDYLTVEKVGSTSAVLYGYSSFADGRQRVSFSDLTDHRGNKLPSEIRSPKILIRARGVDSAFVVGQETPSGFSLARSANPQYGPVMADLLVVEMGD